MKTTLAPIPRRGKPSATGLFLAAIAIVSCGKRRAPEVDRSSPTASVIAINAALGACDDLEACQRECDAGSADRCRRLAVSYAIGEGVAKDEVRATALYGRACDMKDAPACVFAGQMHEYAHGVPKDDAQAARLYERACDLEWPTGCYNFAIMVENGHGVLQDRAKAADLYEVACNAGAKLACRKASELRRPSAMD